MINEEFYRDLFGWMGTLLSILFCLSPILNFLKLRKGIIKIEEISGLILICNLLNSSFWILYGMRLSQRQMIINNIICGTIAISLVLAFYFYKFEKSKFMLFLVFSGILTIEILLYLIFIVIIENKEAVGNVAIAFNIIMYAAPLQTVIKVFKTKNYKLISLTYSIMGIFTSLCWSFYGYFIHKLKTIIPNGLGIFFSIIQVCIYNIFKLIYIKNKMNLPKDPDLKVVEIYETGKNNDKH